MAPVRRHQAHPASEADTRTHGYIAVVSIAAALLVAFVPVAAASPVLIVAGADEPVAVRAENGKPTTYFRLAENRSLVVVAQGPVVLSVRLRALSSREARGTLRIVRDEGPFSDNPYVLARDRAASIDAAAAEEDDAASEELVLHVPVPDGEHRYALSSVRGPAVLVRLLKTARLNPALAAAPERSVAEAVIETTDAGADDAEQPSTAADVPVVEDEETTQAPAEPERVEGPNALPVVAAPPRPASMPSPAEAPKASAQELALAEESPLRRDRKQGFALSVGGGAIALIGQSPLGEPASEPSAWAPSELAWPVVAELAFDVDPTWSVFLEGGWYGKSRTRMLVDPELGPTAIVRSRLHVAPAVVGFTNRVALGRWMSLRFRLGAAGAWVQGEAARGEDGGVLASEPVQNELAWGGVAGAAFEVNAIVGRFWIEGRYLWLRTDLGMRAQLPAGSFDPIPGEVGGPQLLAGFRLEL